uniref:Putative 50s ribosomal protein l25 n=1 Tax=Anopheles triannulatus TaxID=58253 RepID=A0A2M4APL0_9DIPT
MCKATGIILFVISFSLFLPGTSGSLSHFHSLALAVCLSILHRFIGIAGWISCRKTWSRSRADLLHLLDDFVLFAQIAHIVLGIVLLASGQLCPHLGRRHRQVQLLALGGGGGGGYWRCCRLSGRSIQGHLTGGGSIGHRKGFLRIIDDFVHRRRHRGRRLGAVHCGGTVAVLVMVTVDVVVVGDGVVDAIAFRRLLLSLRLDRVLLLAVLLAVPVARAVRVVVIVGNGRSGRRRSLRQRHLQIVRIGPWIDHQQPGLVRDSLDQLDHLLVRFGRDVVAVHLDDTITLAQARTLRRRPIVHLADVLARATLFGVQIEPVAIEIGPLHHVTEPGFVLGSAIRHGRCRTIRFRGHAVPFFFLMVCWIQSVDSIVVLTHTHTSTQTQTHTHVRSALQHTSID